jgi:hypothetical protein
LWRIKYSSRANSLLERSLAFAPGVAREEVYSQVVGLYLRRGGLAGAAGQRAYSRQQLFEHERLGQVVVGPRVQGADLVAGVVAGREHQDGEVGAFETDAPQHLAAVEPWQRDVEEYEVHRFVHGQPGALFTIVGAEDPVTMSSEAALQKARDRGFVFDDQDQHV